MIYQCGGPGEYLIHQDNTDNSDHAIQNWMNNYEVRQISTMEPELETSNLSDFITGTDPDEPLQLSSISEPRHQLVDVGTNNLHQPIRLYQGIRGHQLIQWTDFFKHHKSSFAWTYSDLKGIPPELGEHRIILEGNAKPKRVC